MPWIYSILCSCDGHSQEAGSGTLVNVQPPLSSISCTSRATLEQHLVHKSSHP